MSSDHFTSLSIEELSVIVPAYDVLELISVSRRGALYKAHQRSLDRPVTIKVLPPEIGRDPALREAFETEAKAMARLNHPNLVDVFDFGNADGILFIIMEDIPGRNLHETTHGHHVEHKETARLIADVCHGLAHAHEQGILHRNLNPSNILISAEAEPKIIDFGISNLPQPGSSAAAGSENAAFVAPENVASVQADIYAVGITLYRLLTGSLPEAPYSPPSAAMLTDATLDEITARALNPDPAQRYQHAADMAADLEAWLKKSGTPPTQALIRTMMAGQTPNVTATPIRHNAYNTLASANASGNGAKIVVVVVLAVIIGIAGIVLSSASKGKKPSTTDSKAAPAAEPRPNKPQQPSPPAKPKPAPPTPRPAQPEPKAPIATIPKPAPKPEPTVKTTPPKPPEKPEPPEFDRETWLANARSVMVTKGRSSLAEHDKSLLKNIDRFERNVNRILRKMDRNLRKPAQIKAKESFEKFRMLGRLPDKAPDGTPEQITKIYQQALDDQKKVEGKFLTDFTRLRVIYLQGLDRKISQLKEEGNDDHAAALEKELKLTQRDMSRFLLILRGLSTDPKPDEKNKEKSKK